MYEREKDKTQRNKDRDVNRNRYRDLNREPVGPSNKNKQPNIHTRRKGSPGINSCLAGKRP